MFECDFIYSKEKVPGESVCLCGARIKDAGWLLSSTDPLCVLNMCVHAVALNGFSASD